MKQYPAYPTYKTTGCDWFPEIPSHWGIDRAKWSISLCQNGVWGAEPDGDDDLVCIRVADFDRQTLRVSTQKLTMRSIAEKDRNYRLLNNGDLLLEKSGGGEQQLVGAVIEFDQTFPAVTSNFIARMVASDVMNSRFLVYLHSHLYSGRVNFRSIKQTTGIQNLDSQAYLDEPITYPPLDEQQAIVCFLDFKIAQIDALIAKKKELLDKLAEKRTALISHAVTKGLDPLVPIKDSGVAWLGNVPKHWHIMRIKNVATHNDESLDDGTDPDFEIGYVDISSVSLINGVEQSELMTFEKSPSRARRKVKDGDIIVSTVRTYLKAIAAISNPPDNMIVSTGFAVIRPKENFHSSFTGYLLQTTGFVGEVVSYSVGVSYPAINASDLVRIAAVVPPLDEQIAIAQFLDKQVERSNSQRQKIEDVISKLQEYRSALITNAVTGKIDVRDFAIPHISETISS